MRRRPNRRGATIVQWAVMAALIVIVALGAISLLGTRASNKLGQTGSDLATPQNLTKRFGK